jgi:hypothetical protein|tara:strand:- start:595 stop:972 length:378 start_codon:yes stop_codon:yes gene_type:complete
MRSLMNFIGSYWKEIALAGLLFAVSFLWWKDHKGLIDAYDASVQSYETRIEGLKQSYETEALKKEEAFSEFKERLYLLEAERLDFIEELDNKKSERKVELVKMRRSDPDGFVLKIETQFGFEHVE